MKLFKKHKTKNITVGIRECRTCENNLRCEECSYPKENEMLKAEIERLNKELHNQRAEKDIFKESYYSAKKKLETAKNEAIKKFWSKLKTHSRKMQSSDFSGEFWDKAVLVEDGDNILEEMVGED